MFKEHDVVKFRGIKSGAGTIVHCYTHHDTYEVEFEDGVVVPVQGKDLEKVEKKQEEVR